MTMVDAQRRKALDELTLGGDIVRAYVSAETADRAPSVWVGSTRASGSCAARIGW